MYRRFFIPILVMSSIAIVFAISYIFVTRPGRIQPFLKSLYPNVEMNHSLKIEFPYNVENRGHFYQGDTSMLLIHNYTQSAIRFSEDKPVRLYYYDKHKKTWVETADIMVHPEGLSSTLESGTSQSPYTGAYLINPPSIYPDPVDLLIVMVGQTMNTGEKVGAYTRLRLLPQGNNNN